MKISIRELVDQIDTPFDHWFIGNDLPEHIGLYEVFSDLGEHGFTSRPIIQWLCTDSIVGTHLIYLNGEVVAIRNQSGRKMTATYNWASEAVYDRVYDYIRQLSKPTRPAISTIDWEDTLDTDDMRLEFSEQVVYDHVVYQDALCPVIKKFYGYDDKTWKKIVISVDGVEKTVNVHDCVMPIALKSI